MIFVNSVLRFVLCLDLADAPDEPYDHRSLFDRLEEQKQKKQMEYEEAHKLSE